MATFARSSRRADTARAVRIASLETTYEPSVGDSPLTKREARERAMYRGNASNWHLCEAKAITMRARSPARQRTHVEGLPPAQVCGLPLAKYRKR